MIDHNESNIRKNNNIEYVKTNYEVETKKERSIVKKNSWQVSEGKQEDISINNRKNQLNLTLEMVNRRSVDTQSETLE
jgi:hypothetical protein